MREGGSHRGDQQLRLEGFAELRDYRVDVAPFLQYEVREGREAREAGAVPQNSSGRLPDPLQFALDLEG